MAAFDRRIATDLELEVFWANKSRKLRKFGASRFAMVNYGRLMLSAAKRLSISLGLYRSARTLYRMLRRSEHRGFVAHRHLLSEFIKAGDLAFDVGANIGEKTEIMLSLGARVISFEPQPTLAREVRARRLGSSKLIVVEAAVGARSGVAELLLTRSTGMASIRPDWSRSEALGRISVDVTTLDNEIEAHGVPSFCKIDVEGLEVDVLRGLSLPINAISFEYHCSAEAVTRVYQCIDELARLGDYEFNLIGTKQANWLLPKWERGPIFRKYFPNCAEPHFYGDIFARVA